jgi:hypothetical protein
VKKSATFFRRLFHAAGEIIKKMLPQATFIDFHGCAVSTGLPFLSYLVLFSFFVRRERAVENISRQDRL